MGRPRVEGFPAVSLQVRLDIGFGQDDFPPSTRGGDTALGHEATDEPLSGTGYASIASRMVK
jgi:hypothetical protein